MSETIWKVLAVADMPVVVADNQWSTLKNSFNASGADRFGISAAAVVAEVRAAVAKHGKAVSSNALAVPPEAYVKCLWMVLESVQASLPSLGLSADQKKSIEGAKQWVKDVNDNASVAAAVTTPSDAVDGGSVAQTSAHAVNVGCSRRRMRFGQQEGLI